MLLGVGARGGAVALAQRLVVGETRGRGRSELRLQLEARGRDDRATRRGRLERHPTQPFDPGNEDRSRR